MTHTEPAARPRVICHMLGSIDGRIVVDGWPASGEARRQYELVHASYRAEAWMCGRVTMEAFAGAVRPAAEVSLVHSGAPREDHLAPGEHDSFAIAVDPSGRLAWESNDIDGDHVVAILSERVSDEYLASLREHGVSYLLAGAPDVDLALALRKIGERLGVRTLMLEGGGGINGGMLRAGLVDEVSLLVAAGGGRADRHAGGVRRPRGHRAAATLPGVGRAAGRRRALAPLPRRWKHLRRPGRDRRVTASPATGRATHTSRTGGGATWHHPPFQITSSKPPRVDLRAPLAKPGLPYCPWTGAGADVAAQQYAVPFAPIPQSSLEPTATDRSANEGSALTGDGLTY